MSTFRGSHEKLSRSRARTTRRQLLAGGLVAGSLIAGTAGVALAGGGSGVLGTVLTTPASIMLGQDTAARDGDRRTDSDARGPGEVTKVPCDAAKLVAALLHADTQGGGTLQLAPRCTYVLTEGAFDDDRFDGGVRDAREAADQAENGGAPARPERSPAQVRRDNSSGLPVVYHPITIRGEGATITRDSRAAEFRFFTVRDGGDLRLTDVTLRNGRSVAEGGSVHVVHGANAVLEGVTITQSISLSATGGGGAVFNDGNLRVVDSTFTDNAATARTGRGGGILNGGVLSMSGSTFTRNSAKSLGGGFANFRGAADVSGSSFEQNHADQGGGMASFSARTRVWDTEVVGNTARVGGGIANGDATVAMRGLQVKENVATGDGGGIWTSRGLATLDQSIVRANTAHGNGGGLFVDRSNVPVRHSELTGNGAVGARSTGGGIHATGGQLSLFGSRVTENRSVHAPGGVSGRHLRINVDDKTGLTDNRPTNCQGGAASVQACFR
ncbi:hypothetical protein [Micromonospora sp. SH-82]|uniref:hypothetical protein n=1 Tax=Micromonospora sp. SH-82 TaxID=3132938 RepID=UPI003EC06EC4